MLYSSEKSLNLQSASCSFAWWEETRRPRRNRQRMQKPCTERLQAGIQTCHLTKSWHIEGQIQSWNAQKTLTEPMFYLVLTVKLPLTTHLLSLGCAVLKRRLLPDNRHIKILSPWQTIINHQSMFSFIRGVKGLLHISICFRHKCEQATL